jgi:hypothetical protein
MRRLKMPRALPAAATAATLALALSSCSLVPDTRSQIQSYAQQHIGAELAKLKTYLMTAAENSPDANQLVATILAGDFRNANGFSDRSIFARQNLGANATIPDQGLSDVITDVRTIGPEVAFTSVVYLTAEGGSGATHQSEPRYACIAVRLDPAKPPAVPSFGDTECPHALIPALKKDPDSERINLSDVRAGGLPCGTAPATSTRWGSCA